LVAGVICVTTSLAATAAGARSAGITGSWTGRYTLGAPADVSLTIHGTRARVALGAGQGGPREVGVSASGDVRFRVPGRPPLVFRAALRGDALVGTVEQGRARGAFNAHRGADSALFARGLYARGGRTVAVVDDPYGPARLVDLDSGEVHALFPTGAGFRIGSGFAAERPSRGSARFDLTAARLPGGRLARVRVRELEVRFPSAGSMLSGTLALPPGRGPHPAVVWIHGSGPTTRAYLPDLQAVLLRHGVAVLAYDKRGIGQSAGRYPGESPTQGAIDVLARDAAAAARFLAAQPELDPKRIGLAGHSQAGWIMPLAATRERAIRFLIAFAGPAVTADESDLYQTLAGEGETPQQLSDEEVDAKVLEQGPSGFDPMPSIRRLAIPSAWFYGELDKHIPTRLSVRLLEPVARTSGRDLSVVVLPKANHALVETTTGLTSEMLRSPRFAGGLFAQVGDWLRGHGFGG
jgi:dienelactone hydrolase